MAKNKKNNLTKEIQEKALLVSTPGYDIDKNEVQYGRDHDDRVADERFRTNKKPHKCKAGRCNKFIDKE